MNSAGRHYLRLHLLSAIGRLTSELTEGKRHRAVPLPYFEKGHGTRTRLKAPVKTNWENFTFRRRLETKGQLSFVLLR